MTYPAAPLSNPWATGYVNATTMYNNTTLPLNEIQAVFVNQGTGSAAHAVLGSSLTGITTATTVLTTSVSMVSGRKYLGLAYFSGTQNSATGVPNVSLGGPSSTQGLMYFQGTASGNTVYGSSMVFNAPGSNATGTWTITASTSAGTLTVASAFILVIDLGTT